jgi:hypothetical protein
LAEQVEWIDSYRRSAADQRQRPGFKLSCY